MITLCKKRYKHIFAILSFFSIGATLTYNLPTVYDNYMTSPFIDNLYLVRINKTCDQL